MIAAETVIGYGRTGTGSGTAETVTHIIEGGIHDHLPTMVGREIPTMTTQILEDETEVVFHHQIPTGDLLVLHQVCIFSFNS